MLYIKPDYYDDFCCTADQCEDTCCAGWQIMIDPESLDRYKKEKGPYRRELHKGISWREKAFRQKKNHRCAFLNENNLCDLYTALGEEALCDTCNRYPRHIEEFENVREMSLSISCPEVARYLMNRKDPVSFQYIETEEEESCEDFESMDFDVLLYDILEQGRGLLLSILQNRKISLKKRFEKALHLAADIEKLVEEGNAFSAFPLFEEYENGEEIYQKRKLIRKEKYSKEVFRRILTLERLRMDWGNLVKESEDILYDNKNISYLDLDAEFKDWQKRTGDDVKIVLEQLAVYFTTTYFCGAVYDGNILAKVQMSILSVYVIEELLKARWYRNEKQLDSEDFMEIAYRFSRELEHSDENLIHMEKIAEAALPVC